MVEPHTPTSFEDFKSPILGAAFSVDDEVAKTQEFVEELKQPLHKLNDVFDELHDRTTQMASLASPVGTNSEIADLRQRLIDQDQKHKDVITDIHGIIDELELLQSQYVANIRKEVERELTEQTDKLVQERVAEYLRTHITQELQDEVARSNREPPQDQLHPDSQILNTGLPMSPRNPPSALEGPSTSTLSHTVASPVHPAQPSALVHSSNSLDITSPPPTSPTPSISDANQLDVGSHTSVPRELTTKKADATEDSLEVLTKSTPTPSPESEDHQLAEQEHNDKVEAAGKEKVEAERKAEVADEIRKLEEAAWLEKERNELHQKQEEWLRKEVEAQELQRLKEEEERRLKLAWLEKERKEVEVQELQRLKEEEEEEKWRLKLKQEEEGKLKTKQEEEKALRLAQEREKEGKSQKEKEEREEQERLSKLAEETILRLEEEAAAKAKAEAISEPEPEEREEAEVEAYKRDGKQDRQIEDGKTTSISSPTSDEEAAAKAKAEAISEPESDEREEAELEAHKGDGKLDKQIEDGMTTSPTCDEEVAAKAKAEAISDPEPEEREEAELEAHKPEGDGKLDKQIEDGMTTSISSPTSDKEAAAKAKAEAISDPEPEEREEAELEAHKGDGKQDKQIGDDKTPSIRSPTSGKRRPGPLDLTSAIKSASPVVASLAAARFIADIATVSYPEGYQGPHPDLNQNVKNGKFRYDPEFLLQFMSVCKERPAALPPLDSIGLKAVDHSRVMSRGASGHRPSGAVPPSRRASVGFGFTPSNLGKLGAMGHFGTMGTGSKLSSEERYANSNRAASIAKMKESYQRQISMSRGGLGRGGDRGNFYNPQVESDGWAAAGSGSGSLSPPPKAGNLSNFGKISKTQPLMFGTSSDFAGNKGAENKREAISRTNPTRKHPVLQFGSVLVEVSSPAAESQRNDYAEEEASTEMTEEAALKKISEDLKEFFAVRNLEEAEVYFSSLPPQYHHILVDKIVSTAVESKEEDAKLVSQFFDLAASKELCSATSFEEGLTLVVEIIDDIAIDAPKAFQLLAMMVKGASLSQERLFNLASKSLDSDKFLALLQ